MNKKIIENNNHSVRYEVYFLGKKYIVTRNIDFYEYNKKNKNIQRTVVREITIDDGKIRKITEYNRKGKIKLIKHMKSFHEIPHGEYIQFKNKMNKKYILFRKRYSNGIMEGEQVWYDENGDIIKIESYKDSKKHGLFKNRVNKNVVEYYFIENKIVHKNVYMKYNMKKIIKELEKR